jgi:hypothetical protein
MRAAHGGSGDQDRRGQQRHQDKRAREWCTWQCGAGILPGRREICQQPTEVTAGPRGQGLRHPLIELRLVEAAFAEVLAQLGHHRIPFRVGYPQVRVGIPAVTAGLAGLREADSPWPPGGGSCCILPGLIYVNHLVLSVPAGAIGRIAPIRFQSETIAIHNYIPSS